MKKKKSIFKGIIIPISWDEKWSVTGISLQATNDMEYLIKNNKIGIQLIEYVNANVEVYGKISVRLDGKMCIMISDYKIL